MRFVWETCVRCNKLKRDAVRTWATATAPGNCSDRAATADTAVTPLPPGHTRNVQFSGTSSFKGWFTSTGSSGSTGLITTDFGTQASKAETTSPAGRQKRMREEGCEWV